MDTDRRCGQGHTRQSIRTSYEISVSHAGVPVCSFHSKQLGVYSTCHSMYSCEYACEAAVSSACTPGTNHVGGGVDSFDSFALSTSTVCPLSWTAAASPSVGIVYVYRYAVPVYFMYIGFQPKSHKRIPSPREIPRPSPFTLLLRGILPQLRVPSLSDKCIDVSTACIIETETCKILGLDMHGYSYYCCIDNREGCQSKTGAYIVRILRV